MFAICSKKKKKIGCNLLIPQISKIHYIVGWLDEFVYEHCIYIYISTPLEMQLQNIHRDNPEYFYICGLYYIRSSLSDVF